MCIVRPTEYQCHYTISYACVASHGFSCFTCGWHPIPSSITYPDALGRHRKLCDEQLEEYRQQLTVSHSTFHNVDEALVEIMFQEDCGCNFSYKCDEQLKEYQMTETAIVTEPENENLKEGPDGRLWYLNHGPVCTSCESWVPLTPYRYGHSDYEMRLQAHMNQCNGDLESSSNMFTAEEARESMERPPQALHDALEHFFLEAIGEDENGGTIYRVRIPESVLNTIDDALHDMQAQAAFDNSRGGSMSRKARAREDYSKSVLAIQWLEKVKDDSK